MASDPPDTPLTVSCTIVGFGVAVKTEFSVAKFAKYKIAGFLVKVLQKVDDDNLGLVSWNNKEDSFQGLKELAQRAASLKQAAVEKPISPSGDKDPEKYSSGPSTFQRKDPVKHGSGGRTIPVQQLLDRGVEKDAETGGSSGSKGPGWMAPGRGEPISEARRIQSLEGIVPSKRPSELAREGCSAAVLAEKYAEAKVARQREAVIAAMKGQVPPPRPKSPVLRPLGKVLSDVQKAIMAVSGPGSRSMDLPSLVPLAGSLPVAGRSKTALAEIKFELTDSDEEKSPSPKRGKAQPGQQPMPQGWQAVMTRKLAPKARQEDKDEDTSPGQSRSPARPAPPSGAPRRSGRRVMKPKEADSADSSPASSMLTLGQRQRSSGGREQTEPGVSPASTPPPTESQRISPVSFGSGFRAASSTVGDLGRQAAPDKRLGSGSSKSCDLPRERPREAPRVMATQHLPALKERPPRQDSEPPAQVRDSTLIDAGFLPGDDEDDDEDEEEEEEQGDDDCDSSDSSRDSGDRGNIEDPEHGEPSLGPA